MSSLSAAALADAAAVRAARRPAPIAVPRTADEGEDAVLGLLFALAALLYLAVWLIVGPPVVG